jgi:plastocyanin
MFAKAFILSSVALLVSAANYDVNVGGLDSSSNPILKFNPEFVNAAVGDTVTFHFQQKNHSVVQTSFNEVCHPLLDATTYQPVFQTQFHPVANTDTDFPTEVYTVTDASKPLWFFCSQTGHCGKGMIFSINCPSTGTNTLDNFLAAALAVGAQQAAEASSASAWSATATPDVYGGQTYAPVYAPTVTNTVTFAQSTWTTTYQSYENSPEPTPAVPGGVTHTITVGGNGTLTYDPPSIQANVMDTVKFVFTTKNHTITQSSFGNPCRKLSLTNPGQAAFDSGFIPGAADGSATFSFVVNDTAPIWAYCRQTGHCGQGMVFAVNSDESSAKNFAAFQTLARTLNGTTAAAPSGTGSSSGSSGFMSATVLGGAASIVLVGFGSVVALLL